MIDTVDVQQDEAIIAQEDIVLLAKVGAPFGVQGFNHIQSYTDPVDNVLTYKSWLVGSKGRWRKVKVASGRRHGKGVVVKFADIADRTEAQKMTNLEIAVSRQDFPDLDEGSFYWADLEGLSVVTTAGVALGKVSYLYEVGDNTNMLVQEGSQERHIPFIEPDFVTNVCFDKKVITVDWDPDL